MAEQTITSLCYVSDKNDKTTRLCRFADYINGRFVPYVYDTTRDFFGEERDLLIGRNLDVLSEVGEIAVYDWFTYMNSENQWRTNVKKNNDIQWTEVLYLDYVINPSIMIQSLNNGIRLDSWFDGKHDLILVSKADSSGQNAVYLKKGTLKIKDNVISFSSDVVTVPVGFLDMRRYTGSCQCRYSQNDPRRFLRSPDHFEKEKEYIVKEPIEVIKEIILGNISFFDSEALSRREKQLLRSVVTRVTEPTIIDIVCDKLNCTVQEAHRYISEYIEAAKIKLDKQTALSIIEKLIENDVDAVVEMKKAVKEEWLTENETLIAEKKKEIEQFTEEARKAREAAAKVTEQIKQEYDEQVNTLNRTKEENEGLTEAVAKLKKLNEEIEQEIQRRLSSAKENLARAMLDNALLLPAPALQPQAGHEGKKQKAFSLHYQDEETEKTSVFDCYDVIQNDWQMICGDADLSSGYALLALAAFSCNLSLLIAGDGAETIADMFSVSVCGHLPLKLHIQNETNADEIAEAISQQNHQIICISNGLGSGYTVARELMERFRESRFIFTALHGESLNMEPESLFSTFFPVLTDYFYNGQHVQELPTLDCTEELLKLQDGEPYKEAAREARRITGKWLKDDFYAPLLKRRFAKLIAMMIVLGKELDLDETLMHTVQLELVLTPWMKCLRKTERLQQILESDTTLEEEKRTDLFNYIGTDGM